MRVLHLVAGNLFGGVERMLVTLARHRGLAPEMEPQFAVCFTGRFADELNEQGVAVHPLGAVRLSRPWTVRKARRALASVLEREQIDVVVCHGAWPHAALAPVVRRATHRPRLVYFAHDVPRGTRLLERLAKRVRPDLVLVNSQYTAGFVDRLFPGVPAEVQHPPVEPPPQMDRDTVRHEVRAELNCPADAVVIVCACRMEPWKGHRVLLDALARLRDEPRWRCWIAGGAQRPQEHAYVNGLTEQAQRLGIAPRVSFLGERTDVPRLLAAADVHCQPNTGPEPFGIAFVEALQAGLAVVTTDLGGAREILVGRPSCTLVAPDDTTALAEALRERVNGTTRDAPLGAATAQAFDLTDSIRRFAALMRGSAPGSDSQRAETSRCCT